MMMPRGRPVKNPLSGASPVRVAADIAMAPPGPTTSTRPASQGLIVALIDRQANPPAARGTMMAVWPHWLVPGSGQRMGLRPASSHPSSPRRE